MRELATPSSPQAARVLVDYLLTQKITAEVRMEEGQSVVWVHNEDDLEKARAIWEEYRAAPDDSRYKAAHKPAQELRKLKEKVERNYAKLYKDADHFWGRPHPSSVPATMILIAISVAITLWTNFDIKKQYEHKLTFMDPAIPTFAAVTWEDKESQEQAQADIRRKQLEPLRRGELWRLITPIFLHMTWLHLIFDMYALFTLGGIIEFRRNALWLTLFVLISGVFSNTMQFYFPRVFDLYEHHEVSFGVALFGGMSGVCYALFGYLAAKTIYAPEPGLWLPYDAIGLMTLWLVICMTGALGPIANTAHMAGFVFGIVVAIAPKLWTRWRHHRTKMPRT